MEQTYVYHLQVRLPEKPNLEGWEEHWYEIRPYDRTTDGPPPFWWPTRRNFFSDAAAYRAAARLRKFGADVVVQTKRCDWPEVLS